MTNNDFNEEFKKLSVEENKIYSDTQKQFKELMIHIEEGFNLFSQIVDKIEKENAVGNSCKKYATFILSFRIVRIARSAYWCITHGYYATGQALLRLLFENHLLLFYLRDNENEAEEWMKGKQFRPAFLRKHVSVPYNKVYSQLSEFVHPKIETCRDWLFTDRGKEGSFWVTKFDKKLASISLTSLDIFFSATIILIPLSFIDAFAKQRQEGDSLTKIIGSWNKKGKEVVKKAFEKVL